MTFLQPRDPRWQGSQRWYLAIDLIKNAVLFFFIILIIVETTLYRNWYNTYYSTVEFDSNETALDFFARIGIALLSDLLATLLTFLLQRKCHFHPVYALTQSLVLAIIYPIILTFNTIVVVSEESSMDHVDTWRALCYGEMGLQAALTGCWVALVVCSCVSVHEWRRVRGEERVKGWVRGEMELKDLGTERMDSKDVTGERVFV